jgi:hypothetical protein
MTLSYGTSFADANTKVVVLSDGNVGIGTTFPSGKLEVVGNGLFSGSVETSQLKLSALNTAPTSATDTGTTGEIKVDADYIYVCTATDTWKRAALTTW